MENCLHDMCHIALLLPLLALPVLWMWPLAVSVPTYAAVAIVSAAIYCYAILAMRRPVETGAEAMVGATGKIVGKPRHAPCGADRKRALECPITRCPP
jgi:hypothetical protein